MNRITISHQNDLGEDIDKSYCYKVVQAIKSFPISRALRCLIIGTIKYFRHEMGKQ